RRPSLFISASTINRCAEFLICLLNYGLVSKGWEYVARIDSNGNTRRVSAKLDASCRLLLQTEKTDGLKLICNAFSDQNAEVMILDQDLQITKKFEYPNIGMTHLGHVYSLADGSVILFGSTKSLMSAFLPTLLLYRADGSLLGKYEFEGMKNQGWIADGLPTGVPGEFVAIRATGNPSSKTAMTFIRRR
ncbi:MAG: hypothetical protein ACRETW_03105, partial [Stenotrophobium sp.]